MSYSREFFIYFMTNFPPKEPPVEHEIMPIIKKRWSPLAFSDQAISPAEINRLFEAMRWAPSSYNEQPWRVIYATKDKPEEFERLASLLVEGNHWAKKAYLLLLICSMPNFAKNNKPNLHHAYDTGAGIENLFLQATEMNLIGHEMAGFDHEKAHGLLNIPPEVNVLTMMAIGHPGNSAELPPELLEREKSPRTRKPIDAIVFKSKWTKNT